MKNVLYNYTFLYCHKGILFARICKRLIMKAWILAIGTPSCQTTTALPFWYFSIIHSVICKSKNNRHFLYFVLTHNHTWATFLNSPIITCNQARFFAAAFS